MVEKNPIRLNYDGSNPDGFAEFQSSDFVGLDDGGTGGSYSSLADLRIGLGLQIGSNIQAYDADLTTISNLVHSDGAFIVSTGTAWQVESGATARTSLGLGTGDTPTFTGLTLSGSATIQGNLDVQGELTSTTSTVITVDDAFVKLNTGNSEADAGIIVDTSDTDDARLFYDVSTNRWVLGEGGTYDEILTQTSTDTLTGKTLDGGSNTFTNLPNSAFSNSSLTFSDGSNSSAVGLGGTVTFTGGAGVDISESSGTLTFTTDLSEITADLTERVDDQVATLLQAGDNITLSYIDGAGTLTISAAVGTEEAQDIVGAQFVTNGSHTGISFAYDDSNDGAIDATVSLSSFDTDNLSEGSSNLYYTDTRFDTRLATKDTDNLSEGSSNLYFTNARARTSVSVTDSGGDGSLSYNNSTGVFTYTGPSASEVRAHFSAGTGVTLSSGEISIGQAVGTTNDVTFNDLIVSGDLTVSGTTTTVNTETINLADNTITLNSNATGSATEDGGIEIERGSDTNKTLLWNETTDKWTVGAETFVAATFEGNLTGNVTGNVTGTVSSIANHDTDSLSEGSSNLYYTDARFDTRLATKDTGDLTEGTNLYYTNTRFDTRLATKDTDNLTEGSSNLYYTDARARASVSATASSGLTYNSSTGAFNLSAIPNSNLANSSVTINSNSLALGGTLTLDTDDIGEGSNQYFTTARVDNHLSGGTGIDYSSGSIAIDSTVVTESSTDTLTNKTINFEDNTAIIEVDVTVSNSSGNNKYLLDGKTSASLQLISGVTYRFDQSDSSNSGHPFLLSTTLDGTHNSGANYTMGVTTSGTPGSSGAYTQIVVDASSSDRLFYYCQSHSNMGGGVIELQGNSIVTFAVTVANVSGNKYHLDGETSASVQLVPGTVYRFDQSDSSNSGHPLKLSATKDGTHNSGSEYTTNVVTSGTPGTGDSYTEIVVNAATSDTLYYYCSSHSGMGGDSVISVQGVSLSDSTTDDLTEGSSNLYFTNARARSAVSVTDSGGDGSLAYNSSTGVMTYTGPSATEVRSHFSAGTGITLSSGEISIPQAIATTSDVTFNDLVVSGDLTVSGTTTTLNTETLTVDDNIIVLNNNITGTPSENSGIEVERGTSTNKTLIWNETDDKWTIGSETFVAGTVEANLTGNVTGNLTGNVTGDLTGNVTGNVTGTVSSIANQDTDALSEGSSNLYYTQTRFDSAFTAKDTDDLSEGSSNLYYTATRFNTAFSGKSTSDLTEGTNKYFTEERVDDRVNSLLTAGSNITLTYDDNANTLTIASVDTEDDLSNNDTDDLSEGTNNKYFTDERVDDRVNALLTAGSNISLTYDDTANTLTIASTDTEDDLSNNTTSDLAEGTNLYYTNARADARIALANLEDLSNVGFTTPGSSENQKVVSWDNSAGAFALVSVSGLSGSGETNTASNIGTAGVGLFDAKVGEDLQFKKLNAGSSKITITDDTSNNEVDIDFGSVSINDLSDVDTATSSPTTGQALKWSGSNWIPGNASSAISQLSDVTLTSLATNEVLRYNGSAWVNVALTSDNTSEGSTNLYFTNARARGAISAASGSGLSYNSSTGQFTTSAIPNAQLANSSITVTDGSNSTATSLGGTITFSGTSNEVEVAESSGTITVGLPSDTTIGNDLTVTNDLSVGGDTAITGNLTVSGTTTTVNSNTVNIGDSVITLNSDETGTPSQDGGIEIERGTATNKTLVWDETNDKWTVGSETFVASTFEGNATGLTTTFLTGKTALTSASVADDDVLLVYDTSTTSYKKITKSNLVASSGSSLTGEAPLTLSDSSSDPIEFLNLGSTGTDIDLTLTDGTVDPIQITSTSASATAFRDNDNDTKILVEATTDADDIRMSTAGTERLRIESDGVLDIKSAKLKINGGAGTNGQVLTTNGSGTISWADSGGSVGVNDLTDASTTGLATGDSLVYDGSNFVPQRPTNIEDADGDTRVHVEESADEDKVRIDTGGTERMIIDNNATMSANGGFFIHRTTLASGETFTITANTGTVAAGPLDIEGTVDVAGTLVVV